MKKLLTLALVVASLSGCQKDNQTETVYQVNNATSKAAWKGSAPDHFHVGSFDVTGSLTANSRGTIKNGNFVIPIASIQDFDLPDPVRQQLLTHLKSADFFNAAIHPNANFKITRVVPYNKADTAAVAGANYLITGDYSMVGETHPISFPAKITSTADSLKAEAKFNLDRTKWGMKSYTNPAEGLYILPEVNMHLSIRAAKNIR